MDMIKRPNWIPVVAGLIKKNNTYLLGLRPKGGSQAGVWEFPGGKIENFEQPEDALKRELKEELGIDITVGDLKRVCTHSYGDNALVLIFFEVLFWQGAPKNLHHEKLSWHTKAELMKLALPEANKKIFPILD